MEWFQSISQALKWSQLININTVEGKHETYQREQIRSLSPDWIRSDPRSNPRGPHNMIFNFQDFGTYVRYTSKGHQRYISDILACCRTLTCSTYSSKLRNRFFPESTCQWNLRERSVIVSSEVGIRWNAEEKYKSWYRRKIAVKRVNGLILR